jgi:phosphotransferase system enzyme I (PtsP)
LCKRRRRRGVFSSGRREIEIKQLDEYPSVSHQLAKTLEQTHLLAPILAAAATVVARHLRCGACSVFLVEPGETRPRLHAFFAEDAPASGVLPPEVSEALAHQVVSRRVASAREEPTRSFLGVPMDLRGRTAGAIVVESAGGYVFSAEEIFTLESVAAQLVGIVVNARLIEALDRGEAPALLLGPDPERREPGRGENIIQGTAACPGIGIGAAAFRGLHDLGADVRAIPSRGEEAEKARVRDALVKTRNEIAELSAIAAHDIDEEHALIFGSHLLLMSDPALLDRIDRALASGASAPVAINDALEELEDLLRVVPDAYLQERVEDIDDLRARLLSHVLDAGGPVKREGLILLTKRIPPSLVVELKAQRAQGIVTEVGGVSSHGALLARALGIPTVTGVTDLLDSVRVGEEVIVDGEAGTVIARPEPATLEAYRDRARRAEQLRTQHAQYRDRPLETADGVRVGIFANIATASDLAIARDNGAEGVGLYRTEFPFIVREQFPTREEQVRIYRKAYEAFPEGPINFRVLDLGGDKFLRGRSLGTPRNPFHGYRGIRVLFDHPHILCDQVQAFALAASGRPLNILIPMVTSLDELRRIKALIAEALLALRGDEVLPAPTLGVMIEAPAAVEIAPDLAKEADYFSIGTNDLVQYTLVIDREDARMSSPRDALHPAILRMVRRTVLAAHAAGKPVSVCGEMAARRDLAAALVALGVDALSVVPRAIPELKQGLAKISIGRLVEAMDEVLACSDARTLEAALNEHLSPGSRS